MVSSGDTLSPSKELSYAGEGTGTGTGDFEM